MTAATLMANQNVRIHRPERKRRLTKHDMEPMITLVENLLSLHASLNTRFDVVRKTVKFDHPGEYRFGVLGRLLDSRDHERLEYAEQLGLRLESDAVPLSPLGS